MKRILHVLHSGNFSGAENIAMNLGLMFKEYYDIAFVIFKYGNFKKKLEEVGLNYILLENFSLKELNYKINKFDPHIIHAHDFRASIFSGILFPNKCIISHLHNNPPWIRFPNIYSISYLMLVPKFKKIIGVSNAIKNEFFCNFLMSSKFICLPNFVNESFIIKKAQEPCNFKNIDLLFVGRLTKQKDPIKFINIIKRLKNYIPNIKAVMLGDGELREKCIKEIKYNDLTSNIFLLGFVENPYSYIKESKLVIITSQWEGFGLIAVEAMMLGKPILASPVGGLKDIIIHDKTGFFCRGIDDYVRSVLYLFSNPQKYLEFSANATLESRKYTNIGIYKEKLLSIYEEDCK
jgi:glycosyltransferase involved in cell wall biosynthesis